MAVLHAQGRGTICRSTKDLFLRRPVRVVMAECRVRRIGTVFTGSEAISSLTGAGRTCIPRAYLQVPRRRATSRRTPRIEREGDRKLVCSSPFGYIGATLTGAGGWLAREPCRQHVHLACRMKWYPHFDLTS
jgi:hypothetical protein